uniref:Post-GPI attachment to proteins factor 3 n=2 Tax=Haemonchus TaxID=6288 RepID=A0A0N4WQ67_HAEPC
LHTDKTESYYVQCTVIFASLIVFLAYNCWQAALSVSYHEHLRMQRNPALAKPTVLIVNKPLY